ncbi:MAG: DUF1214 domain-containing protein [Myxococcota bacterium]
MDDVERLLSGDAWRDWCDRLKEAGEAILGEGFPADPRDRAEGFRWLTRLVVHAVQLEVEAGDPRHPSLLRYETPHNQWGGPNPDNAYLRANVDPRHRYRVWGDVRGVRQAIFSLHEGEMHLGELGVFGERSLDQLEVGGDGRLEIRLGGEEQPGNWMPLDPRARIFSIRVYQSDWERDAAPAFHIERIGQEGVPRPALDPAFVARALDRAATWVERSVPFWNDYTAKGWSRATPNVANPPRPAPGGARDILYGSCFWELGDDEALHVETRVPDADYWGFSIHTLGWLESGDFAERQTSLNDHQAHVDPDGRVRIVLAHRDPAVPNWIDTEGRRRGLLVYRFVWARDEPLPEAKVIPLGDVRAHLPRDHPSIDPATRRAALSRRREAVWNRCL